MGGKKSKVKGDDDGAPKRTSKTRDNVPVPEGQGLPGLDGDAPKDKKEVERERRRSDAGHHNYVRKLVASGTESLQMDLSDKELEEVPEEVFASPELYKLDLSYNALVELPPRVGDLRELSVLDLSNNVEFDFFPDEFFTLYELSDLNVSNTALVAIGDDFANFRKLRKLRCNNCQQLAHITKNVGQLTRLEVLEFAGCALSYLPYLDLGKLTKLKRVTFKQNRFPKRIKNAINAKSDNIGELLEFFRAGTLLSIDPSTPDQPTPKDRGKTTHGQTRPMSMAVKPLKEQAGAELMSTSDDMPKLNIGAGGGDGDGSDASGSGHERRSDGGSDGESGDGEWPDDNMPANLMPLSARGLTEDERNKDNSEIAADLKKDIKADRNATLARIQATKAERQKRKALTMSTLVSPQVGLKSSQEV